MLVLRGQDVQGQIDHFYDRGLMRFKEGSAEGVDDYFGTACALFVTSKEIVEENLQLLI